jgi:steroid delta-isomerase-like uncharacterized protein
MPRRLRQLIPILVATFGLGAADAATPQPAATCPMEQPRRNEATARIVFEEILSRGRIAENEHIYHPDFVVRGLTRDSSRAEDRAASEGWRAMAPDLSVTVMHILSNCDHVAVHWVASGTNTGTGNGFPATGRPVRLRGMTFYRFADGRIIEEWSAFDMYSVMRQLGLLGEGQ